VTYEEFLVRVVEDGLLSIEADESLQAHPKWMAGARQGFEACRGKTAVELAALLAETLRDVLNATTQHYQDLDDYWHDRYRAAQVEWVAMCVSAGVANERGRPIVLPNLRAAMKAGELLGVSRRGHGDLS
jgi:hypothetical protein